VSAPVEAVVKKYPVELAYVISQIMVMSEDSASITPLWVLKAYPIVENILSLLRGASCSACEYCRASLDVVKA